MSKQRMPRQIQATFTPDSEGFWIVNFPQFPGLHTFGETLKEAKRRAQEAFDAWIDQHDQIGIPVRIKG